MNSFVIQCSLGYLDKAQQMYSKETIDLSTIESAFRVSCINGHIEIAKWLHPFWITSSVNWP